MRSASSALPELLELPAQFLYRRTLPFGIPLRVPGVGVGAQIGQFFAKFLQPRLAGRIGLLGQRAASSISSRVTRRVISSNSAGIESISVRSRAHASSTRSIALSGRKRSVM